MQKIYYIKREILEIPNTLLKKKKEKDLLDKMNASKKELESKMQEVTNMSEKGEWICNYSEYYSNLWRVIKGLREIESLWSERVKDKDERLKDFSELIDKIIDATEFGAQIEFHIDCENI